MGSNIDYVTVCPQTTSDRRQFRIFLRPAPEATNSLRFRRILHVPHFPLDCGHATPPIGTSVPETPCSIGTSTAGCLKMNAPEKANLRFLGASKKQIYQ